MIYQTRIDSLVGTIYLAGDDEGLLELTFGDDRNVVEDRIENARPFDEVISQLRAYFARELCEFDVPLKPQGTPFQLAVWEQLQKIRSGQTISYGELARRIGRPNASRAVGAANGRNPISIIIPCHRVIGNNGKLVGYGGGLENKQKLLALEKGEFKV